MLSNQRKMPRILVFDTETTGLPKSRYSKPENTQEWPHIVQLSYIIYDSDRQVMEKCVDHIIRVPDGVIINDKCVSIHGISNQVSLEKGVPLVSILSSFLEDFQKVDLVIAHNMEFDLNMILVEMWRRRDFYEWFIPIIGESNKLFCTMQEGTDLCKIKMLGSYKGKEKDLYKYPNLAELHQTLFGVIPIHLHNSLNDVVICLRCYYKMKYGSDICSENADIRNFVKALL